MSKNRIFTKEENELVYEKMSLALNDISNEKTKFLYCSNGKRRILVDLDEPDFYGLNIVPRNGYCEVSVRNKKNGKKHQKALGRHLLNVIDPLIQVDHENRNQLDYRRCNLREASRRTNSLNKSRWNFNNKYKGVYTENGKLVIEVCHFYCTHRMIAPSNLTEDECAEIYDMMSLNLNGLNHETNFPKLKYTQDMIDSTAKKWGHLFRVRHRKNNISIEVGTELKRAKGIFENLFKNNKINENDYSKLVFHLNTMISIKNLI